MVRAIFPAIVVAAVAMGMCAGCQNVKQKTHETVNFIEGASDTVLDRSPAEVEKAARQAIDDLHLIYINTDTTPHGDNPQTVITARNHSDEKLTVTIIPEGTQSRVIVVTGPLTNTLLRNKAIDDIMYRLGLAGPPIVPYTSPATTQPATLPAAP